MIQRVTDEQIFVAPVQFSILPRVNITRIKAGVTTPNVQNCSVFLCENGGALTIVDFLGGADGQDIRIKGDGFTTIANNTKIKTNTAANKLLAANKIYRFTYINGVWYEDA